MRRIIAWLVSAIVGIVSGTGAEGGGGTGGRPGGGTVKEEPTNEDRGQCIDDAGNVRHGVTLKDCKEAGGRTFIPDDPNKATVDITPV